MATKKNIEYILTLRDKFSAKLEKITARMEKFGASATRAGRALTIAVTAPLVALAGFSLKAASDLEETQSKFDVVFSSIAKKANDFALNFKKSFGVSELAAKKLLSNTGDLLTGFGFTQEEAFNLSKEVNILAGDLASFSNVEGGTESASIALTKALLGEAESVKALGIVINQGTKEFKAAVKQQQALTGQTVLQAKAIVILRMATDQSKNAIGDFQRTIGSFANQVRISRARLEDISITIGRILMPTAQKILKVFNKWITAFEKLDLKTKKIIVVVAGLAAALGPLLLILGVLMTTVIPGLIAAFAALTLPIILVIAAIAGAAFLIIKNWDKVVAYFTTGPGVEMLESFRIITDSTLISIVALWDRASSSIMQIWDALNTNLGDSSTSVMGFIGDTINLMLKNIASAFSGVSDLITGNWKGFWENMNDIATRNTTPIVNLFLKGIIKILEAVSAMSGIFAPLDREFKALIDFQIKGLKIFKSVNDSLIKSLEKRDKLQDKFGKRLSRERDKRRQREISGGGDAGKPKKPALFGGGGDAGGDGGTTTGTGAVTRIVSAAPKISNINIDKLIEMVNINTTNLTEGTQQVKKILVEALVGALSDTQNLTR